MTTLPNLPKLPKFIKDWFQETLNRWAIEKPAYFKRWQAISKVIFAISGVPYLLVQVHLLWPDFHLPTFVEVLSNKFFFGVSVAVFYLSQITVTTTTVGTTVEGTSVKVVDTTKMPFTAKVEAEKVDASVPPPEVLPNVPEAQDVEALTDADGPSKIN